MKDERLRLLIPMEKLEWGAQQQIYDALKLDFLKILAVMPDCHQGYSLPIGGVALLERVISPAYVGYDIGCGMCLIVLPVKMDEFGKDQNDYLGEIFREIYQKIPVGYNRRKEGLPYEEFKSSCGSKELDKSIAEKLYTQHGTLGSGNHFIEIGENSEGYATITIHSGSRRPGWEIAKHYMDLSDLEDKDLPNGFLHLDGELGQAYLNDMNYALEYALANRMRMMNEVISIIMGKNAKFGKLRVINENHNHAERDGKFVLHRKGATPARLGQLGVIPGNMRDGVYVTEGLGNTEYLQSASHGAGRQKSRKQAKKDISLDELQENMKGILSLIVPQLLDEAPGAYKGLTNVIAMQEGVVVKIVDRVKPVISVKGVDKASTEDILMMVDERLG
jgi:tRNA-splicing ligase RtcB